MTPPPARSRDPYGVAVRTLRQWTAERSFAPGQPLVITDLADRIGLSPTPVREALARLAGEGLIDRRKGKGYSYPADAAPGLIDLYGLQRAYVHAALTVLFRGREALQKAAPSPGAGLEAAGVFSAAVSQSANAALIDAHARVSQRLAAPDCADRALAPEAGLSLRRMAEAMAEGAPGPLLDLLDLYHEGRCARAWRVARALDGCEPQADSA